MRFYKILTIFLTLAAFFIPVAASAAVLYVASEKNNFNVGDKFMVNIRIDSESIGVNAAQATVQYPKDAIEIINTDKTGSVFEFWLREPEFSNDTGRLVFVGGATSGFSGKTLQVLKINFKVKGNGKADITFTDAAVTASDGTGTNVLSTLRGLQVTVIPKTENLIPKTINLPQQIVRPAVPTGKLPVKPEVVVSLYPDQSKWYDLSEPFFVNWQLPADVTAVVTVINKDPGYMPFQSEGLFDNKQFSQLSDGIWYLHVRFKNNIDWGPVAHYKISIDTTPPLPLNLKIDNPKSDNPTPMAKYSASDALSGVVEIRIFIDNNGPFSGEAGSFKPEPQLPGKHTMLVKVVDRAGNSTDNSINFEILPIEMPRINLINKKITIGTDDRLMIQGSAVPDVNIIITIEDKSKFLVIRDETRANLQGKWEFSLDKELRSGDYFVSVKAKDSRGATSLSTEPAKIRFIDKPIISLFGLDITLRDLTIILVVAGVLAALWFWRKTLLRLAKSQRETIIINRDLKNAFNLIKEDLSKISGIVKKDVPTDTRAFEFNEINKKIGDTLDKMEKYLSEDIERLE